MKGEKMKDGGEHTCPFCNGHGTVYTEEADELVCPKCDGTGIFVKLQSKPTKPK